MDGLEKALADAFAKEIVTLLVCGDERTARALARSLAGAVERAFLVGFSTDTEGWRTSNSAFFTKLEGEVTARTGVRSALRQDPDFIVLEAPLAELEGELLANAALTGHGVLARAEGCPDEKALLAGLAAVDPFLIASAFPRIAVTDAKGVARLHAHDGALVWKRGDPLPDFERLTGRKKHTPPPPPVREPVPPLEPALFEQIRAKIGPSLRPTWVPVLVDPSDDAGRSMLSGRPLLRAGEEWPRCPSCSSAMPLVFQLRLADLPADARIAAPPRSTHLQFFYCCSTGCSVDAAWEGFAKNRLLRFIESGEPASSLPDFEQSFPPRDIESWERHLESPHWEDIQLDEALRDARFHLGERLDEPDVSDDERALAGPRGGQKLLGWPRWEQGPEWQSCPRCGEKLTFVFQVDANSGPLEMLFAADGFGHVSQCAQHPDVLAFAWACG